MSPKDPCIRGTTPGCCCGEVESSGGGAPWEDPGALGAAPERIRGTLASSLSFTFCHAVGGLSHHVHHPYHPTSHQKPKAVGLPSLLEPLQLKSIISGILL